MTAQALPDRLLSVAEVAEIVGVSKQSVGRWIRSGDLAAVRLGNGPAARLRVHPADLEGFVEPVGRRWPVRDFLATRREEAAR